MRLSLSFRVIQLVLYVRYAAQFAAYFSVDSILFIVDGVRHKNAFWRFSIYLFIFIIDDKWLYRFELKYLRKLSSSNDDRHAAYV